MRGAVSRRTILSLALALTLASCVGRMQPMGPPLGAPRLADDAIMTADGYRLPLRIWRRQGSPRAVILALHGFDDYSQAFARAGRLWAEDGVITYAYDQRGFGATAGRGIWAGAETMAQDAITAATLLAERHDPLPLYLLGESMGGAVAMTAMAERPDLPVDGVALIAPAVWDVAGMPAWQTTLAAFLRDLTPGQIFTGAGLGLVPTDNFIALRTMSRDPLMLRENRLDTLAGLLDLMGRAMAAAPALEGPLLVMYGDREQIVPAIAVETLLERLGDSDGIRTAFYPEGYHLLLRDFSAAIPIGDIASWTRDPAAPLPSGADRRGALIGR